MCKIKLIIGLLITLITFSNVIAGNVDTKPTTQEKIKQIIDKLQKDEPTIEQVQEKSLQALQKNIIGRDLLKRLKTSSWLPQISAKFGHDASSGRSLREKNSQPDTVYHKRDNDLKFEFRVQLDLNKIIFNPDEIKVVNVIMRQRQLQQILLENITTKYYKRRSLQVTSKIIKPQNPKKIIEIQMKIMQLTADINALTAGWFAKQI